MINIYELQRFLDKQRDDLLDFLKPVGLAVDSASFCPKWQTKHSQPEHYNISEMTSLELKLKLYKVVKYG